MKHPITLSIVIPVFNEEAVLAIFWQQLANVLNTLALQYEVIFVDDGSRDGTWQIIQQLSAQNNDCHGIRFTRNFGKEAALQAGLENACGSAVVIMDGDGQHPPALLPKMLELWRKKGVPLIAAQKRTRHYDSWIQRSYAYLFNQLMQKLTGLNLENSTDYRLLDRQVVDALLQCPEQVRFFRGMTIWSGFESHTLLFDVPARLAGVSHWPRLALFKLALQALIAYSAAPLHYLFGAGLLGVFVSLLLGVQALYSWLAGIAVSGWTSLTLVILFFGSLNLIASGLLGLYLAQVFNEIKKRPAYLIREISRASIK